MTVNVNMFIMHKLLIRLYNGEETEGHKNTYEINSLHFYITLLKNSVNQQRIPQFSCGDVPLLFFFIAFAL